jgi:hypothetical protein
LVRPDRDRIGGEWPVEVDETLVDGQAAVTDTLSL